MCHRAPQSTLFPYTTLFRSRDEDLHPLRDRGVRLVEGRLADRTDDLSLHLCQTTLDQTDRSEEHTSELQSLTNLVCRLLLEKKKISIPSHRIAHITSRRAPR